MEQDLYSENQRLRLQLDVLLSQARKNEEKMRRFREQEYRLISTSSLVDLIKMMIYDYRSTFELDMVTLVLLDPEHKMHCMLESSGLVLEQVPELMLVSSTEPLDELYGVSLQPVLDSMRNSHYASFFPEFKQPLKSVALLPLVRNGELIGSLNLGSYQAERFVTGTGTDFLQRLSAVASICLENAANHERLKQIGLTDSLTCVNNRWFFEQRLHEEVADAIRHQHPLSCMFLDVDHFKRINDELGHQTGDVVLREVAALINSQLRSSDIHARYGGEEFVVLLPNTTSEYAREIAERVRHAIESYIFPVPGARQRRVTISIGISMLALKEAGKEVDLLAREFVAAADHALYEAKHQGRNRVACADVVPSMLASVGG